MTHVTAMVAEDEAPQREKLCELLREVWPTIEIVADCADGLAARLVLEPELQGDVAVALRRAHLEHWAGAAFDDGDGIELALVVVDVRHADLEAEETESHEPFLSCQLRAAKPRRVKFPEQPGNGVG